MAIFVDTFGTGKIPEARICELIRKHFPVKPRDIIRKLRLSRPIYNKMGSNLPFTVKGRFDPILSPFRSIRRSYVQARLDKLTKP